MTKSEWTTAIALARSKADLANIDIQHLDGCGLPGFERVVTSVYAVAKLLRWQCCGIFGGWDAMEENEMFKIAQRKFIVSHQQ